MKKFLTILVLSLFALSLIAKFLASSSANEASKMELDAKKYNDLKAHWGDKKSSKAKLLALSDDLGSKYFSATVSQKQISANLFSISFLVINSDEFDAIMQRVIDGSFEIKKLEITKNEAAYLVTLEVLI